MFHCHTVKVSTAVVLYIRSSVCFWTFEGFTTWLMILVICKKFINLLATSFSLSYDSVHPKEWYVQIHQSVLLSVTILYMFISVFPRRQFEVCRHFGTLCQFHLQRLDVDTGSHFYTHSRRAETGGTRTITRPQPNTSLYTSPPTPTHPLWTAHYLIPLVRQPKGNLSTGI